MGIQSRRFVDASTKKLRPGGPRKTMVNECFVASAVESKLNIVGGRGTTYVPETNCAVLPFMAKVPTKEYGPACKVPGRTNAIFVPAEPPTVNGTEEVHDCTPAELVSTIV